MASGMIPRAFIDELVNRVDIVELIDSYVPLKKQGSSFVACCPFHHEKTPSFNVNAKKQFYHCFGCGVSGNVISFGINYLHLSFPETIETLAARVGLQVPREGDPQKYRESQNLYQLLEKVSVYYQQQLKAADAQPAIDYLKHRGIDGKIAKQFQLGFSLPGWHTLEHVFNADTQALIASGMLIQRDDGNHYDRYRNRIMYPIHDRHGRIIGFGGRAIDKTQKPKYLNSPETVIFQKNRELYGLHQVVNTQNDSANIIIVEGYMDVIALAQHGIHNVVATLGTTTSIYHIQLLNKHTKRLIFCFDGDAAGKQAAWRALENCLAYLNMGLDAQFIFLPEGDDPDSLVRKEGADAFSKRIEQAKSFPQFFFETLLQSVDIATFSGKSQLVNLTKPYLHKMGSGPFQQLILDELARITRIDVDRLEQLATLQTTEKMPQSAQVIQRTPARIAIALLLQHPNIYYEHPHVFENNSFINQPQSTLNKLIAQIATHPEVTTGMLLETFRNTPEFEALTKLAAWDHKVPQEALARECIDTLTFLSKQEHESKIQTLIAKARQEGLVEEERILLQQLLRKRHQLFANITGKD
jgi:DNA primase